MVQGIAIQSKMGTGMKLLNEVVELLSDESGSLTNALLKMKVVMHKIGHKELAEWVNDELNGYGKDKEVPPYRVTHARLKGNIQSIVGTELSQVLPISHLPEWFRKSLDRHQLGQSIKVLEQYSKGEHSSLMHEIQPEMFHKINEGFAQGAWVQKAWTQLEVSQIDAVLMEVRSRLLSFALELQDKLGDTKDDTEVRAAAQEIDARAMFNHSIIGDNATFVLGDHNMTHVKNSVKKDDFESLAALLREKGVSDRDVKDLQIAIETDKSAPDLANKEFGPNVKGWMSKMMDKVINAAWNIELGVAAGLITEALKAYYF
jgi:hypothetical protein